MPTKSIRLSDEENNELKEFVARTGAVEATALKQAALRGLREERIDRAVLYYLDGHTASEATDLADLPHAEFLDLLMERGIHVLEAPSTLPTELESLAKRLQSERLAVAARKVGGVVA